MGETEFGCQWSVDLLSSYPLSGTLQHLSYILIPFRVERGNIRVHREPDPNCAQAEKE